MVERLADAVVITDAGGIIQYVNPAYAGMTGYAKDDALQQNVRSIHSGSDPAKSYEELWKTALSGQACHGEIIARRKDGSAYTEEIHISAFVDGRGGISGYIATAREVTERRTAGAPQSSPASNVESSKAAIVVALPSEDKDSAIKTRNDDSDDRIGPNEALVTQHEKRILVAEDDPTTMAVALAQLKKLGYRAHAVANGAEAVELLEGGGYDLVLMDCQMPIMDGYEATRRIRHSSKPDIPIIAVTAYVLPGDLDKCTRAGMNGFLPKPLNLARLAGMLAKWCPLSTQRGTSGIVELGVSNTETAVFDSEALLGRLMSDRPLANAILTGFLADAPSQLRNLRERFAEGDSRGARLAAHALKGSSATVSANRLSAVAREMEAAAESAELDEFGDLLPRLVDELECFKCALKMTGWLEGQAR